MQEHELQQYLLREYPQENARCEWKEFKNLKNSFCGDEKNDVISYVSAIANMVGGHLVVIGVNGKTLEIVGTDISRLAFYGQMFKKVHSRVQEKEENAWNVKTFLGKCRLMRNEESFPGTLENVLRNEEPQTHFRNMCFQPTRRKNNNYACSEIC